VGEVMRYSDNPPLDAVYDLLARLSAPRNPDEQRLDEVMIVADALIASGQDRTWASVWWGYAALHYDMSDDALRRAAHLLRDVDGPREARAAALMLRAEIMMTQASYGLVSPSPSEERSLLEVAVSLEPTWLSLHMRLARALKTEGQDAKAHRHGAEVLALLNRFSSTQDPFDSAFTGRNYDHSYVKQEVTKLALPLG